MPQTEKIMTAITNTRRARNCRPLQVLCAILLLFCYPAPAHPGIGLVIDSKGNIYYTDTKQIWKQTPEGQKTIAVPAVHSHELYMDKHDNLFGEHLWYVSATEKFYHYQWCLKNTGEWVYVTDSLECYTQPASFSFVRDDDGNMYWYEKDRTDSIRFIKKDTTGKKTTIASGKFGDVRWMFSTPRGDIYFLDLDNLLTITPDGKFRFIARNLCTGNLQTAALGERHSVYGVWFDNAGNTYAAVADDKCVKKISADGAVAIVYQSEYPLNGLFDKNGDLWILENDAVKKVMMPVTMQKKATTGWVSNTTKYMVVIAGLLMVFVFAVRQISRKKK
jgi:hypothetical protein